MRENRADPKGIKYAKQEAERASSSFGLLNEKVQRWIWSKNWNELHNIQEKAIPAILDGKKDIILAAATAAGKTEAAFLPITSRLIGIEKERTGFEVLYVSPLRALINDQFGRIEDLCADLKIKVWKWHGDVSASHKARARKTPSGIVLITPESLEAILVRRGLEAPGLFANLRYVVIDELHAFMGSDRGKQLQSLLRRVDVATGRDVPRIGLSATLPDLSLAAEFLRPGYGSGVLCLQSHDADITIKLQVRGYLDTHPEDDGYGIGQAKIAGDLFNKLRGHRNLIFANSRRNVELYATLLAELSEQDGVPGEFFAHHGSLSKELREDAEERMKDERYPASIVCTSTLELGIDVGAIESVAQIDSPYAVSSLRQRLGRSGRRSGQAAVLRMYVMEQPLHNKIHLEDALRLNTVRAIGLVNLMLERWNEPPYGPELHLTALIQQILALIKQFCGVSASQAWTLLIQSDCFANVTEDLFKNILRDMGTSELIEQAPDGTLLPGVLGERITEHYEFYAVFQTPEEYRLVHGDKTLGTLPLENQLWVDALVIFAGKRWRVTDVDAGKRVVHVKPAYGGIPPRFGGEIGPVHSHVVQAMRNIYHLPGAYSYLDERARNLLQEGCEAYSNAGLHERRIVPHEGKHLLFPWCGGRESLALALALTKKGLKAAPLQIAIEVEKTKGTDLIAALEEIAGEPAPDPVALALQVPDRILGKYDMYLSDRLQALNFSRARLSVEAVPMLAKEIVDSQS